MDHNDAQAMLVAMNSLGTIAQARSADELLTHWNSSAELFQSARRALAVCESMFAKASQMRGATDLPGAREALLELRKAIDEESPGHLNSSARRFVTCLGASIPSASTSRTDC